MGVIVDPKHKYCGERVAVLYGTPKMYHVILLDKRRPDKNVFNYNAADRVDNFRKDIKPLYHRVEKDSDNFGRVFVHFRWK